MKPYLWSVDGTPPLPPTRPRWRRFIELYLPMVVVYLMVATLVAIVLYPHMVVTVPSGYVGVLWKRFGGGTVLDPRRLKNEGFNLISPWNEVFLYDLRLQSFTESYNAKREQHDLPVREFDYVLVSTASGFEADGEKA